MIRSSFLSLSALALLTFATGCATTPGKLKSKEELALASDFKVITPTKPDQKAVLAKLPADRFTRLTYGKKTFYVLPDQRDHKAYVGSPKQYKAYQQLSHAKEEAVEYDHDASHPVPKKSSVRLDGWTGWEGINDDWSAENGQAL